MQERKEEKWETQRSAKCSVKLKPLTLEVKTLTTNSWGGKI